MRKFVYRSLQNFIHMKENKYLHCVYYKCIYQLKEKDYEDNIIYAYE